MTTRANRAESTSRSALVARAKAEKARREKKRRAALDSFAEFVRQAVAAGVVPGLSRTGLDWSPMLEALCFETQCMLEGWVVAAGLGTPAMIARQDALWALHGLVRAVGELLVQNWIGNMPPGTLKSTIVMVLANAWIWLLAPAFAFGAASQNDANVVRDSMATQDVVTSAWYRSTFHIEWKIRSDASGIGEWRTTAGGFRLSQTIGAGFTGQHVDGAFIDDPDDADKVWNLPERRKTQNRFTRAIENRVNDERISIRLVLQQSTHVDDLSRYLLAIARWSIEKLKGWAHFCVPMEFGRGPKYAPAVTPFGTRDWRSTPGEPIDAKRFPPSVLADKREKLGTNGYEGQYNQNPASLDGGMLDRAWVRFFVVQDSPQALNPAALRKRPDGCKQRDEEPAYVLQLRRDGSMDLDFLTITVDCSNGSESATASAVGILVGGGKGQLRFMFDDRTKVMGILEMYAAIKACISAWPADRVLIELKAAGSSTIADLKQALAAGDVLGPDGQPSHVVVEAVTDVKDSKIGRHRATLNAWENGFVFVLDGSTWLYPTKVDDGCIDEICSFPNSKRSDRVDAWSQLMTRYRTATGGAKAGAKW